MRDKKKVLEFVKCLLEHHGVMEVDSSGRVTMSRWLLGVVSSSHHASKPVLSCEESSLLTA
ncbi:hypothetical protein Nmel_004096 [Mimus melanotis]